jgi:hypothetical protein
MEISDVNGARKLTHLRHLGFRHRVSFHVPPTVDRIGVSVPVAGPIER